MVRIKKQFISLRTRMILLFVPVIVITLTVTGWFCYHRTQKVIRQYQLDMAGNLLERASFGVDTILDRAIQTTEGILYFPSVYQAVLKSGQLNDPDETKMEEYRATISFLRALEQQSGYMRIRIFAHGIGSLLPEDNFRLFSYERLEKELPVSDMVQNRMDQVRIVDTYHYPGYAGTAEEKWVFSVVRLIVNGPDYYVEAAVSLDLDSTGILTEWVSEDNDTQKLFLVNKDGRVLAGSDPAMINTQVPAELTAALYENELWQDRSNYYLSRPVKGTDWRLFMEVSDSYVLEDTRSILNTMLGMILTACFLGILAVFILSRTLTDRIQVLTRTIEHCTTQNTLPEILGLHIQDARGEYAETAILIDAYNRMLERISALSAENTSMALRESRYRMEALRLQINSHFLYNTLASIKGYIEMNDAGTAASLLTELAVFFKHSLAKGGICVMLQEELELVKTYLKIQQLVYEDIFTYQIHVPQFLLNTLIPKFLLQPIVENSVIHGILEKGEGGRIVLSVSQQADRIRICIEDNGPGFTAEMLGEYTTGNSQKHGQGIGLRNVTMRLRLYFKSSARLWLENLQDGGGCVVIEIPEDAIPQEEAEAYDQDLIGG